MQSKSSSYFQIYFNTVLPPTPRSSKWSHPFRPPPPHTHTYHLITPMLSFVPPISSSFIWSPEYSLVMNSNYEVAHYIASFSPSLLPFVGPNFLPKNKLITLLTVTIPTILCTFFTTKTIKGFSLCYRISGLCPTSGILGRMQEFRNEVFFWEHRRWTDSTKPVTVTVICQRRNPLEIK
jgi:hypothetical protein